ncbi:AI-2E family transporter [Singulisphaera acidiphila]|uniref:Putative permease n=1 Tax=Singulisphaera acidiphila (strain ATCC BAA-1392 / DSM 18658 / VKM B-2454 / MOB10) TaxID=886293 RepID=L0DQA1_SINAD|nr:AI-2E family transporter [Singulisphaera acidiphila]AGA31579.1 putative permease [Singulisphaera acidiphila DSM 18658]
MSEDASEFPDDLEASPSPLGSTKTAEVIRLLALVAWTAGLFALCVWLSVPLLPAITWGVALAILAWPMHRRIRRHVARPGLAAALSAAVVVVLLLGPGLFVTYHLAREATSAAQRVRGDEAAAQIRAKAASIPGGKAVVKWFDRAGIDAEKEVSQIIRSSTQGASDFVQGSASAALQFLVAVFILYHLFHDRAEFLSGLRGMLPLSEEESNFLLKRAADSVHANLYATVLTSLIDTAGFGLAFWMVGLPAPFLWAVVVFVLSLLPVVGSGLVWVPAAVYLALSGHWVGFAALVGWGLFTSIAIDNLLYARLAGGRMRMHEVPALIAFLGGLAVFGVSGVVLGPAAFAVTSALMEVWKRRLSGTTTVS